jgi:glycosyltransferase involved in cell wall biosynthesis
MQKKYRLLIIGPKNRHIENFVDRVIENTEALEVISEGPMNLPSEVKTYFTNFSFVRLANYWSTINLIKKRIKTFDPQILHVHQMNSVAFFVILANLFTNKPMVFTAWGSDILLMPERNRFFLWLARWILKKGTAFTSDSSFMAEKMRSLLPEKNLDIVICNFGVPETDLKLEKENIIYSNRMHNNLYRIPKVVEAFAKFKKTEFGKDWKLIIAGRGEQTEELNRLIGIHQLEKDVEMLGFIDNEANFNNYAKSKVFVSIPESDATAMSLLEAMYHGCFPVLCDLPANREWVKEGQSGEIVKDIDSDFFSCLEIYDFKSVEEGNRKKIIEEGTISVSEKRFKELHLKIIGN